MARKGHAIYVPPSGPPSDPFLPNIGDLYWVDGLLYGRGDPAHRRPAVVLEVPSPIHSPIQIVTRTSDLTVRGVRHTSTAELALDEEEGVFSDLCNVSKDQWRSPHVEHIGTLDAETMNAVRERFG